MNPTYIKTSALLVALCFSVSVWAQQIQILDGSTQEPVSFATISFGNGLGTFAGDDGVFVFSKEKYADVAVIYISSVGYVEKGLNTEELPPVIYLDPETSQLSEVVISAPKKGKFKIRKKKPTTHIDHFTSWLPTVESEVAVYLEQHEGKSTQIATLLLPINAESQYASNGKRKYATIFRVQFYKNENGIPGSPLIHEKIVFPIDEKSDKLFKLDIVRYGIFIPKEGLFASLQVLGYADTKGALIQSKKYREVKTRRGIKKISTAFRPLLPFSNQLSGQNTYVRRIFFNDKKWQIFDETYNENSKLIQSGHRNYGLGAEFRVYED